MLRDLNEIPLPQVKVFEDLAWDDDLATLTYAAEPLSRGCFLCHPFSLSDCQEVSSAVLLEEPSRKELTRSAAGEAAG